MSIHAAATYFSSPLFMKAGARVRTYQYESSRIRIDSPQIHLALSRLRYDLSLTVYRAGFSGGAKFAGRTP